MNMQCSQHQATTTATQGKYTCAGCMYVCMYLRTLNSFLLSLSFSLQGSLSPHFPDLLSDVMGHPFETEETLQRGTSFAQCNGSRLRDAS